MALTGEMCLQQALRDRAVLYATIFGAVALAFALHIHALSPSLWQDEIASVKIAGEPWRLLWSDWMRRETNPPLYYSILKMWMALAGNSDFALRLLSFLCGVPGVIAACLLGTRAAGWRGGLFATLLVAVDPSHIYFSQQIRGYALGHSTVLMAVLGAAQYWTRGALPRTRNAGLFIYAVATVIALYVHTTLVLLPIAINLFALGTQVRCSRAVRMLLQWASVQAVIALCWAWWLTMTWWQIHHSANLAWIQRPGIGDALRMVDQAFLADPPFHLHRLLVVVMPAAFAFGALRLRSSTLALLPVVALVIPLLLVLATMRSPVLLPRTVFWSNGPFLVTAGIGLAAIDRWSLGWLAASGLVLAALCDDVARPGRMVQEPLRAITDAIAGIDPAGRVIVSGPPDAFAIERYCHAPRCRLDIHTIALQGETWMADMPRPGPVAPDDVAGLVQSRFFTVTRHHRADPAPVLNSFAHASRLIIPGSAENGIEVLVWKK